MMTHFLSTHNFFFFFLSFLKKLNLVDCEANLTRVSYKLVSYKKCVVITLIRFIQLDLLIDASVITVVNQCSFLNSIAKISPHFS